MIERFLKNELNGWISVEKTRGSKGALMWWGVAHQVLWVLSWR